MGEATDPPVILAQHLAASRRRGEPFADAWTQATSAALDSGIRSSWERHEWHVVFTETVGEWARAFDQQPALPRERALNRLHDPDALLQQAQ